MTTTITQTLPLMMVEWSDVQGMVSDFFSTSLVASAVAVVLALLLAPVLAGSIRAVFGGGSRA